MAASNSTGKHLNFCRQMVKQYSNLLLIPNLKYREPLSHAVDLAQSSTKFILPKGGRLFDDFEFKALDESEPLHMPFKMISLEYESIEGAVPEGGWRSSKRIVFAREREDSIVITPVVYQDHTGTWQPMPEVAIPITHFLDRACPKRNGRVVMKVFNQNSDRISNNNYEDEVGTLLCFLNALQCANIGIEKSLGGKTSKAMHKALAFDDYHILTIKSSASDGLQHADAAGGMHRSPREHLRRGHIRRHANGMKIWVNATVVNPGIGGKVSKDYRLAA